MLQYLRPTTLEEMYNDLDKSRLDLLKNINKDTLIEKAEEYRKLTNLTLEISDQYEALTGELLWVNDYLQV